MKRTALISAALVAVALPLSAQDGTAWNPGENFVTNWDYDDDGKVTLAEVLERRGDLFVSFDDNEDGDLTPEEFANHDQMRDAMWEMRDEARDGMAPGQGRGQGQGMGQQQGRGQGQGMGRQQGQGRTDMSQRGQPGWSPRGTAQFGQPMGQPGYGYAMPPQYGMMQPGGPGWAPAGPGMPGYGYGPQGIWPGYGYGPQPMAPGYGFAPMGPGYGQMPYPMGPQAMPWQIDPGYGAQGSRPGFGPAFQPGEQATAPQGQRGPGNSAQEFAMLDVNADGVVSAEEFVSAGDQWFARFDGDGDGVVTVEDFGPGRR